MQRKKSRTWDRGRFLLWLLPILLVIGYLVLKKDVDLEDILSYEPENRFLLAGVLLFLYGLKSLSIILPISILNAVSGALLDPVLGLFISSMGNILGLSLPYWIGSRRRKNRESMLFETYPKLGKLVNRPIDNVFFTSFFLRFISVLPADIVSLYLGSRQVDYRKYLLGSFLGMAPKMISITLLGTSVTEPGSPLFWSSMAFTILVSVLAIVWYYLWKKRQEKSARRE